MYERNAKNIIQNINNTFKILFVSGPRQVGKTTLLMHLKEKKMNYVTLDDQTLREQAQKDPKLFLEQHQPPLFIDEVQYAKELFPYIKMEVDKHEINGQYWLTGSQQFHLMKNASESLAGRIGIIPLNSFSYSEIKRKKPSIFNPEELQQKEQINVNDIFETIFKGGMPRIYTEKELSRDAYFSGYVDTYLERDIKDLTQVGNEYSFRQFLVSIASRTGEQLNYSALANDCNISTPTAKKWVSILVTTGLVYLLQPYSSSELKRITHMPKIIFMDTGLACYLAGWTNKEALQNSSNAGHFLESFIISEIIKNYNAMGKRPNIYYYRDKEKKEIDLIFYQNNKLYPFEIKKTAAPKKDMIKNFKKLENTKLEIGPGGIICFYDTLLKLDEKNYIVPISSVIC